MLHSPVIQITPFCYQVSIKSLTTLGMMLLAMVKVNISHGGLCSKSKALGVTLKDPGTCLGPKGVFLKWANTWTWAGGSVCKKNSNVTINNIPHPSPLNSCQQAHALVYDWKSVMNNTGCITEPSTRKFTQLLFPCSLSFEWQETYEILKKQKRPWGLYSSILLSRGNVQKTLGSDGLQWTPVHINNPNP